MTEYWDYEQLLCRLVPDKEDDVDGQIDALTRILNDSFDGVQDEFEKQGYDIIQEMRAFLGSILPGMEEHNYDYPLFLGLSQIEHDWTFARFFMHNIKYMWV